MQGWMHCILYVLFENAMGIVKLGAVIAGAPTSRWRLAAPCCLSSQSAEDKCLGCMLCSAAVPCNTSWSCGLALALTLRRVCRHAGPAKGAGVGGHHQAGQQRSPARHICGPASRLPVRAIRLAGCCLHHGAPQPVCSPLHWLPTPLASCT